MTPNEMVESAKSLKGTIKDLMMARAAEDMDNLFPDWRTQGEFDLDPIEFSYTPSEEGFDRPGIKIVATLVHPAATRPYVAEIYIPYEVIADQLNADGNG